MNTEPIERDLSAMQHFCVYCWPTLHRAEFWDADGWACCIECGSHPERQRMMPAHSSGHLDAWRRAA